MTDETVAQPTKPKNTYLTLTLLGSVMILIAITLSPSEPSPNTPHPVSEWDHHQVVEWIGDQGEWAEQYQDAFDDQKINGKLFLLLDEKTLEDLGVSSAFHRTFFLNKISEFNSNPHSPLVTYNDYWSFRETDRRTVTVLTIGMFASPRLTTLYAYLYEFETIFKPFFGVEDPGFFFWITWILFPSSQIASSAFSFFWIHPFLILVLFVSSFWEVISESLMVLRGIPKIIWIISTPLFLILSAIVPFLAPLPCDLLLGIFCLLFVPLHIIDSFLRVVNSTFSMF